ncbi:MAG: Prenyltransferase/squalene oxidase [Parcubacteria group bacterium Greene0714_21]|nr:MAG: Prenyltransferase/squalene oxidase [Parcubacteria group bacterium Greene0714_21]
MEMRNSVVCAVILAAATGLFVLPGAARAALNTTLYIQGPHNFSGHRAPCAIKAAKDTGLISDFLFKDFGGLGLFLDRVNSIASGPAPDYPYWNLWRNSVVSEVGISQITLSNGDAFQLTYGPDKTAIIQGGSVTQSAGGPVVTDVYPRKFDVESAVSFLVASQQQNGSFGHPLFTDWAAVALGAYKGKSATASAAKEELREWLVANSVPEGSVFTDYERRAMALMSLGIDPYSGTSQNIIETIVAGFDGQQFGNPGLVNDDIFAVLVLQKAGYEANVTPLLETLPFILSWQRESGSFGSVDLTAAAVQTLSLFPGSEQRNKALLKARDYLAGQQESTGGFGNVYSTAWVLQAIASLNEDGDGWAMEVDKRTPEHFLALRQALDGGLLQAESKENRIWATSYAIPAALQKGWGKVLVAFPRPVLVQAPIIASTHLEQAAAQELQVQLDAIAEEARLLTLQVVSLELQKVRTQVALLEPRVLVYLRDISRMETFAESADARNLVSKNEETKFLSTLQESLVTVEPIVGSEFSAGIGGATKQLPWQNVLPYVVAGGVLAFLLFGNPKGILSFLQGRLSKVG